MNTRPRQEIEILHDILSSLEEARVGSWGVVIHNNMNSAMWERYSAMMLGAGLIREEGLAPRRAGYEITPRGSELLSIIRAYRSIWRPPDGSVILTSAS